MKKLIFALIFLFPTIVFAGFNICDNNGLSKQGSSPIQGCLYFSDYNITEYDRVKALWSSTRRDFLKIENGIVVEKTQAEKDAILQAEADAQAAAETQRQLDFDSALYNSSVSDAVMDNVDARIDAIASYSDLKAFLKKMARYIYKTR